MKEQNNGIKYQLAAEAINLPTWVLDFIKSKRELHF
jgi:hypothetical protein